MKHTVIRRSVAAAGLLAALAAGGTAFGQGAPYYGAQGYPGYGPYGPHMGYGMMGPGYPGMGMMGPGYPGTGMMGSGQSAQANLIRQQMMLSQINQQLDSIEQQIRQSGQQVDSKVLKSINSAQKATQRALRSIQTAMQQWSDSESEFSAMEKHEYSDDAGKQETE